MRLTFGTRYVYGLCRTATSGNAIHLCSNTRACTILTRAKFVPNTRACTILTRAKFVPNGFLLLEGPISAVGHDTGSLGVVVLAMSVVPGVPIAPSDQFSSSRSVYESHLHTCHTKRCQEQFGAFQDR